MTKRDHDAPVRMAMVGGGPGAFIGPVHRMGAELDRRIRLVAGAFSSDAVRSRSAGLGYGLDEDRIYSDWRTMLAAERGRPDGAELVAIVTPNHLHLPVAVAAIEAGFHVACDKPVTATLAQALELQDAIARSDRVFGVTYTYSGYPMVRRARALVADGAIGTVRKVVVQYPQGWLAAPIEAQGDKQAAWRTDPKQAGAGGCIGDIGVHAFHLAEFVTGLKVDAFVADLAATVPGRMLDDDCNMLLRFAGGARGVLIASQISTGEGNDLSLRVYGSKAGLVWHHGKASQLTLRHADGRTEILEAGTGPQGMGARLPSGHPEGFIEAFGNIYRDIAAAIRGQTDLIDGEVPGIRAGVRSMRFVEQAVAASGQRAGWTALEQDQA